MIVGGTVGTVGTVGTPVKITAAALLCRVFDFVHMQEHTCFLLSSGKIHKISMSSGALKINPSKKVVGL